MMFDAELVPYCGRVYRVKARVERFLSEQTGKDDVIENAGSNPGGRLVPRLLQLLSNGLSKMLALLVEGNLA
jgi:hypothetical protein